MYISRQFLIFQNFLSIVLLLFMFTYLHRCLLLFTIVVVVIYRTSRTHIRTALCPSRRWPCDWSYQPANVAPSSVREDPRSRKSERYAYYSCIVTTTIGILLVYTTNIPQNKKIKVADGLRLWARAHLYFSYFFYKFTLSSKCCWY